MSWPYDEDTCPDRSTARREGERSHEDGYGSFRNPYTGPDHDSYECREAERGWRDGWRRAEYEQERREEESREQAARERHRWEEERLQAAEYEAYLEAQETEVVDEEPA